MNDCVVQNWSLSFKDITFLSFLPQLVCLEAALQTCSVRNTGRFIEDWPDVDNEAIEYVASQLDIKTARPHRAFSDRTARRYRLEVALHLGLSRTQKCHRAELYAWLRDVVCSGGGTVGDMLDQCFFWFLDRHLLPPAESTLIRLVRAAQNAFIDAFLTNVTRSLSSKAMELR